MGVLRRVAIAVRSVEKAREVFELAFDAQFELRLGNGVRVATWSRSGGEPALELVEPVDEENEVARYIRKRGEGVYHLSYAVPDLSAAVAALEGGGARVVRTPSWYRTEDGGHLKEAFLHPKDAHGVLLHLAEE